MKLLELSGWSAFKATCITRKELNCQFTELEDRYDLYGPDKNSLVWHTTILKDGGADAIEFEAVKDSWNGKILNEQLDSDGAPMSRVKVAPSGWNYHKRGVEFVTSTLGSVINNDVAGTALTDAVMKLYAADGTLITDQGIASTDCVKTQLDLEPPYDVYVAGGQIKFYSTLNNDLRLFLLGVPDVPAIYGGSKPFIQNINLRYMALNGGVDADGRAAKWLQYSATYHTNKLRIIMKHDAGFAFPIMLITDMYRQ